MQAGTDPVVRDNKGNTAVMIAASQGGYKVLPFLISSGIDINARNDLGETAFIIATKKEYADAMRMLVELGAEVNQRDNFGKTAYSYIKNQRFVRTSVWNILKEAGATE